MKNHFGKAHLALALVAGLGLWIPTGFAADSVTRVTGGGTGSFGADLDGDGEIDGSHFGLGVLIGHGFASGHFECLMAGNADILGLPLMAVEGKVNDGFADVASASFSGVATVNLANGHIFRGIPFTVTVTAGQAGVGTLQLSVIGAFDGVPGDEVPGNGDYDLPVETVVTGEIRIE